MTDYLLKQLLFLLEPIGFIWLALGLLAIALWWRRRRFFAIAAATLVLLITIVGSTPVPDWLLGSLEKPYTHIRIEDLPSADAIVLLGGGAEPARFEFQNVHLSPAGDRLIAAHALMHLAKAPVLILGGGGGKIDGHWEMEAGHVKELLATWGIPPASMISLSYNGDTHDEALHTRTLAATHGWHRILLVTSANHMRRAVAVFQRQGFEVIPAPCNYLTSLSTAPGPYAFCVPRYDGFSKVAVWLHEQAGWWMYRQRGWVDPS